MEKDYSLLRPFNLEAAKAGGKITTLCAAKHMGSTIHWLWVAGPDQFNRVVTKHFQGELCTPVETKHLRMLPLAWVEGKPVYTGDKLYRECCKDFVEASYITTSEMTGLKYLYYKDPNHGNSEILQGVVEDLTWEKPKQKREGWINIYKDGYCGDIVYGTEKGAKRFISDRLPVDTVKIEWEE